MRVVLAIFTALSLCFGLILAIWSWREQHDFQEISERGEQVLARIVRAYPEVVKSGQAPSYLVELQWTDGLGHKRNFGPTHISDYYWSKITTGGVLTTNYTAIRDLAENPSATPVIVADIAERKFQDEFGVKGGLSFVAFGVLLGGVLAFSLRNYRFNMEYYRLPGASRIEQLAQLQESQDRWRRAADALLGKEANRHFVREAIHRLEESGLRVVPSLNRELIVIRVLRHFANWCTDGDLEKFFSAKPEPVTPLGFDYLMLVHLASDSEYLSPFYGFDDLEPALRNLPNLSEQVLEEILQAHSISIFENASGIAIVNEDPVGEYLTQRIRELISLTCGDFEIDSISESRKAGQLFGQVALSDGRSVSFQVEDEKRPDLTPFFNAMNSLIAPSGKGRFLAFSAESSESLVAAYLRPSEQIAFRRWEEEQTRIGNVVPVDWLS